MSDLVFTASGFPMNLPDDQGDLEVRTVLALVPRIKEVASEAMAAAYEVGANPELSAQGVAAQKGRIGTRALADIEELRSARGMRQALAARVANTPAPSLKDVHPELIGPILNALSNMERVGLLATLKAQVERGDHVAAVVALHAPWPYTLLTEDEKAELAAALRQHTYGGTASAAGRLAEAIELLDRAAKAAADQVRQSCAMATVDAVNQAAHLAAPVKAAPRDPLRDVASGRA